MLVQNHRTVIPDFYGVTTSFTKATLKPGVIVLASEEGAPWVKYMHGDYGKGRGRSSAATIPRIRSTTSATRRRTCRCTRTRPGYRLILNNVLFPAAKKKPLKT